MAVIEFSDGFDAVGWYLQHPHLLDDDAGPDYRYDSDDYCQSCDEHLNYDRGIEGIDYVWKAITPKGRSKVLHPACWQAEIDLLHAEALCPAHTGWNCECQRSED